MIAFATASKQLKVIRANIRWGKSEQSDKQQLPPGAIPLNPTLEDRHVAVTSWFQYGLTDSPLDQQMTQLSHIEILPSCLEGRPTPGTTWAPPLVLTVRSNIPADGSPYNQECQSIVDRWEIINEQSQQVHNAFEQLGLRNSSGSTPPVCSLPSTMRVVCTVGSHI